VAQIEVKKKLTGMDRDGQDKDRKVKTSQMLSYFFHPVHPVHPCLNLLQSEPLPRGEATLH
jgi:hypothetical protein